MNVGLIIFLVIAGLVLAVLGALEVGIRIGTQAKAKLGESAYEGTGTLEGAVFGLLGLLLAFSFATATSRLDARRQQIVQEANAIGTAYLRVDLLPASAQPEIRGLFREYLEARIQVFRSLPDWDAASAETARAGILQKKIWSRSVAATRDDPTQISARLLLPALNEMIDITTTRSIALRTHLPMVVFGLLICVTLLSAVLVGYLMAKRGRRSWLHMVSFALAVAFTIYVVTDLEYPRGGLINLRAADEAMHQLRDAMK